MDSQQTQCPVEMAVNLVGGKWKLVILYQLVSHETRRFNELRRALPTITQRTLTRQLRELENDGLIHREVYAEIPPKVEYSLTDTGRSLHPVLLQLQDWGLSYMSIVPQNAENMSEKQDIAKNYN